MNAIRTPLWYAVVLCLAVGYSHAVLAVPGFTKKNAAPYAKPGDAEVAQIIIKFADDAGIRASNGRLIAGVRSARKPVVGGTEILNSATQVDALRRQKGWNIKRHISTVPELDLDRLRAQGEARSGQALADLNAYFEITLPKNTRFKDIDALLTQLNQLPAVEIAYAATQPTPASHATPSFTNLQTYLNDDDLGIGAGYARFVNGARGDNVHVIDVEVAFNLAHEDAPPVFYQGGVFYNDAEWRNHGTAVLGVLGAQDNGYGVIGIVPNAMLGAQSVFTGQDSQGNWLFNHASAIAAATNQLGAGGVLLLELQEQGPTGGDCSCQQDGVSYGCAALVPAEWLPAVYDAIRLATAGGVVVIEAAGNGGNSLDASVYSDKFNRATHDSGAVMIGASRSSAHAPMCFSNYGARIDANAWGEQVVTIGYGGAPGNGFDGGHGENSWYTNVFGGTSSAGAIVAGFAASVQGGLLAANRAPLTSAQMRDLIAQTGRAQTGNTARAIGRMPNLHTAFDQLGIQADFSALMIPILGLLLD